MKLKFLMLLAYVNLAYANCDETCKILQAVVDRSAGPICIYNKAISLTTQEENLYANAYPSKKYVVSKVAVSDMNVLHKIVIEPTKYGYPLCEINASWGSQLKQLVLRNHKIMRRDYQGE